MSDFKTTAPSGTAPVVTGSAPGEHKPAPAPATAPVVPAHDKPVETKKM
jgi:hypothetical protein